MYEKDFKLEELYLMWLSQTAELLYCIQLNVRPKICYNINHITTMRVRKIQHFPLSFQDW